MAGVWRCRGAACEGIEYSQLRSYELTECSEFLAG